MSSFIVEIVATLCMIGNPADCTELRTPTLFVSPVQCQIMGQQALAEIMAHYPKRRVAKYVCELRTTGHEI